MSGVRGTRGRVGGASMAAGAGFQEGVTAWLAVHLLAEDQAPPLPSLEVTLRIASIACETGQPIDDINARSNVGVTIYIQAKRAVRQLVDREGSDFTDFIEQAVDQHLAVRTVGSDTPARYVLATSPDAARKVRRELRDILERFRSSARDTAIDSFGNTADERSALTTTASIIRRVLSDRGEQPTDEVVRAVLERIVVWELELDGSARSNAIGLLAAAVVPNSTVGAQAWRTLENRALKAAEDHETLDLHGWRRAIRMDGIQLRAIPSLEPDIGRVRAHSSRALADLNRHRLLRVAGGDLSVDREVTAVAHRFVRDGPLLLVGDAGSGKSAVLSGLAGLLQGDGADVVILDAEALASDSLGELSRELALDHDLGEILEAWPGNERGYLLVDGLDETRGRPGVATLRRLVARVAASGSWVPVVAVRRFDLRYSSEIRSIFAGMHGEPAWTDSEFVDTRHVVVGDLSDPELDQLRLHSASLVAMAKTDGVGPLLRRPIHLQLAADLLARGGSEVDLARLRTQLELLDLYWSRLVEEPVAGRASREAVLEAAARLGVSDRLLAFPRTALDAVDAHATTALLGLGTLVEGELQPGAGRPVRFLHGLVADYAIARLVLRPAGAAEALLVDDPVNALFLRRPLELWLTGLWHSGESRDAFWTLALDLCARNDVPEIAKLVAPSIVGQSWTETEDLDPLLTALSDPRRPHALAVLRHLVASLTAPPNSPIAGAEAAPWSRLAVILTAELDEDLVFPVRLLVTLLADARSELTHTQADELGEAARQLLSWLWDNDSSDMVAARFAIRAVCATFESDPLAAETLLRRGLCREHVRNRGYEELRHYADHLGDLAGAPGLIVALYTAAFAFDDAGGTGPGVMLGGPVLSLQSDRRQEFQMARYGLASVFGGLMQRAPEVATAALLRVLRASDQMRRDGYTPGPYATFTTKGVDSRVRDEWRGYRVAWLMSHDDQATLIAAWTSGLATLAVGGDPRLGSSLAVFLANNRTFAGWRILVDAATRDERLIPTIVHVIASAFPVLSAAVLREPLCRLAAAARLQANLMSEFRAGIESPIVALEARVALTGPDLRRRTQLSPEVSRVTSRPFCEG